MRTFHLTWFAFFLCFFGWFAHAPLLPATIGPDLGLTKAQKITAFIASVGITILARIFVGMLCDKIGPRISYVIILVFGAISVAGSAFAYDWPTYLASRLCIGIIGAGFVITQYHTSVMFSPNVVGLANATTAGWGNLGAGATQAAMPMIAAAVLALGLSETEAARWRPAMFIPAIAMIGTAILYWKYTQDTPEGNLERKSSQKHRGVAREVFTDSRVWALFAIYAGCFGMELFVNGRAAAYYQQRFEMSELYAGLLAALFGLMNIFARSLGGWLSDRLALRHGLTARVRWLVLIMVAEGISLFVFARMNALELAVVTMVIFSIFVKMAQGATYSVVSFISNKSGGTVAGLVGAGGNVGAVCYGFFLLKAGLPMQTVLTYFGVLIIGIGLLGLLIRFDREGSAAPDSGAVAKA